jgi:hypothetical protein
MRLGQIELFMLKNAVITGDLRAVMARENVSAARGALEAQADSLVSDYIRQVDFSTIALKNSYRPTERSWPSNIIPL